MEGPKVFLVIDMISLQKPYFLFSYIFLLSDIFSDFGNRIIWNSLYIKSDDYDSPIKDQECSPSGQTVWFNWKRKIDRYIPWRRGAEGPGPALARALRPSSVRRRSRWRSPPPRRTPPLQSTRSRRSPCHPSRQIIWNNTRLVRFSIFTSQKCPISGIAS